MFVGVMKFKEVGYVYRPVLSSEFLRGMTIREPYPCCSILNELMYSNIFMMVTISLLFPKLFQLLSKPFLLLYSVVKQREYF